MTAVLFDYPKNAAFGRVLPKSKIYEHGSPSAAVRQLFVRQVEQIVWQHKLAPETVNLKASSTRILPTPRLEGSLRCPAKCFATR